MYVNISKTCQYFNKFMSIFQKNVNISSNLCQYFKKCQYFNKLTKKLAPEGALLAPRPPMPAKWAYFATWSPVPLYIYILTYAADISKVLFDI